MPEAAGSLVLVLGGARSGKSAHAEALMRESARAPLHYVATAEARDGEMAERIAHHQARRDARWITHDCPFAVDALLSALPPQDSVLVDCLTLWLTNHLLADHDIASEQARLVRAAQVRPGLTVMVANEVGLGLVPETPLGRRFRDAAGRLNQSVAAAAGHVVFIAAGLPLVLKGQRPAFPSEAP